MKSVYANILRIVRTPKVSASQIVRLASFPEIRKRFSAVLSKHRPTKIDVPRDGKFVHFRIRDPGQFDPKSFRIKPIGTSGTKIVVGCPKGKHGKGRCSVGMKLQSVMVPISRVFAEAQRFLKGKKIAANPLLMSVMNPAKRKRFADNAAIPYHVAEAFKNRKRARAGSFVSDGQSIWSYNMRLAHWDNGNVVFDYKRKDQGGQPPSVSTSRHMKALESTIPARAAVSVGQVAANPSRSVNVKLSAYKKIPIATFEKWIRANMPEKINEYRKSIDGYRKFHGVAPKFITWNPVKMGSKHLTDVGFGYSAGKSPTATYIPDGKSRKGKKVYVHTWKNMPESVITADGKTILHPLKGSAVVSNADDINDPEKLAWMRG